jgi:hypothetical protein
MIEINKNLVSSNGDLKIHATVSFMSACVVHDHAKEYALFGDEGKCYRGAVRRGGGAAD